MIREICKELGENSEISPFYNSISNLILNYANYVDSINTLSAKFSLVWGQKLLEKAAILQAFILAGWNAESVDQFYLLQYIFHLTKQG
jgi:hypothetical protein